MKKPGKNGNCYDENGRYFLDHGKDNWKLVHGIVINSADEKPMGHCWIEVKALPNENTGSLLDQAIANLPPEFEVMCIDKSNGNDANLPQMIYYHFGKIQDTIKYSVQEFRELVLKHSTWGPWEIECER